MAHTICKWFIKGQVTLCNRMLLFLGFLGKEELSGKAHRDKETSSKPPSVSKPERLSFLDFTPPC